MTSEFFVPVLSAFGGGVLVAIVNALANRKHLNADTEHIIGESYKAIIAELRTQVDRLQIEVKELRIAVDICQKNHQPCMHCSDQSEGQRTTLGK